MVPIWNTPLKYIIIYYIIYITSKWVNLKIAQKTAIPDAVKNLLRFSLISG
jgi:hypothetical protein